MTYLVTAEFADGSRQEKAEGTPDLAYIAAVHLLQARPLSVTISTPDGTIYGPEEFRRAASTGRLRRDPLEQ